MYRERTFKTPLAIAHMTRIMASLADGKHRSAIEIASAVFLSPRSINEYVRKLRADKKVRIGSWLYNNYPLYTLGEMPDKKRKPSRSSSENHKKYWERKKENPEFLIEHRNRVARYRLNKRQKPIVDIYATIFRRAA